MYPKLTSQIKAKLKKASHLQKMLFQHQKKQRRLMNHNQKGFLTTTKPFSEVLSLEHPGLRK